MKVNAKSINLTKIQKEAEESFRKGFFCCEAVMEIIRSNFELDVPEDVIRMASGMAIGMFFGRTEHKGPTDPNVVKCMSLTKELHDWFKENNTKGVTCCRILTREFDMSQGGHKSQCIYYTGICAAKAAEIIARELGIPTEGEITVQPYEEYIKTRVAPLEA